jgi:predicted oxidoreductase
MEALNHVVRAGKARSIGAANLAVWQLAMLQGAAARHGWTRFISSRQHHDLITGEADLEVNPFRRETGLGVLPWSPLARGRLARPWNAAGSGERHSNDPYADKLDGSDEAAQKKAAVDERRSSQLYSVLGSRNSEPQEASRQVLDRGPRRPIARSWNAARRAPSPHQESHGEVHARASHCHLRRR